MRFHFAQSNADNMRSRISLEKRGPAKRSPGVARLRPHASSLFTSLTCSLLVVYIGRISELLPPLQPLPLGKILVAAILLNLFIGKAAASAAFPSTRISRILIALLTLAIFSVFVSVWRSQSLGFLLHSVFLIALTTFAVFRVSLTQAGRSSIVTSLAICGLVLTSSGILAMGDGRLQVGATYDPNDLAMVLTMLLPFMVLRARTSSGLTRLGWAAACGLCICVVLLTQSRGGLAALIVVVAYLAIVRAWDQKRKHPVRLKNVVIATVALTFLSVPAWTFLPDDAKARFSTMLNLSEDYNVTEKDVGRFAIWSRGMRQLASAPWGSGIAAFSAAEGKLGGRYYTAHNSLVQISVELGVLGGLAFIVLLVALFRGTSSAEARTAARQVLSADSKVRTVAVEAYLPTHIRASLFGYVPAAVFLSQAYQPLLYVLAALISALSVSTDQRASVGRPISAGGPSAD